jgi:hypothetical protein
MCRVHTELGRGAHQIQSAQSEPLLFKTTHRNTICDIVIAHVRVSKAIVADVTLLRAARKVGISVTSRAGGMGWACP